MKTTKYVYPAIFTHEPCGYSVLFPDFEDCATSGETLEEAIEMAKDALCLYLYDMEEHGETIPAPTDIETIARSKLSDGEFATLIDCDTMEYRRFFHAKAVKKTLSIPAWLNSMAEREDINFSAVLQKALRHELGV